MYEELVKKLRDYAAARKGEIAELTSESADAIEQLQKSICPHYIRNVHDRGDDSLCRKYRCEVNALPRWIPVTERLPKEWENVLAYQSASDGDGLIRDAVYIGSGMWREAEMHTMLDLPVTHWMQLPEPPKEETE